MRVNRRLIHFLTRPEVEALLSAPDKHTRNGRRDHALLLVTLQTGLRLSEITGLTHQNITLGSGAHLAHSTVKCNEQIFGVEENLARGLVAEYLSGARVKFILDPLDIGIGQNREVGTFWEVLPEEAVGVFVEAAFPRVIWFGKIG